MGVNCEIRDELPDGSIVFDNFAYDNSIIGVTLDDRVIYCYEYMVQELMSDENLSELDAIEWIDRLSYAGDKAPIIVSLII